MVTDKLVAMRFPKDVAGEEYSGGERGAVRRKRAARGTGTPCSGRVRLNEAEYAAEAFVSRGAAHHDLPFGDGAAPPEDVVRAFMGIMDAAEGAVAVHCRAGLGRTGTLAALWLMREFGFTAWEAMGQGCSKKRRFAPNREALNKIPNRPNRYLMTP